MADLVLLKTRLNHVKPHLRLRAMQELCRRAENAATEFERTDVYLADAIDALVRERDHHVFIAGCRSFAAIQGHWVINNASFLVRYCRGTKQKEETYITILSFLLGRPGNRKNMEKDGKSFFYSKYGHLVPFVPNLFDSSEDELPAFFRFWKQVLTVWSLLYLPQSGNEKLLSDCASAIHWPFGNEPLNSEPEKLLFAAPWKSIQGETEVRSHTLFSKYFAVRLWAAQHLKNPHACGIDFSSDPSPAVQFCAFLNPMCAVEQSEQFFRTRMELQETLPPDALRKFWFKERTLNDHPRRTQSEVDLIVFLRRSHDADSIHEPRQLQSINVCFEDEPDTRIEFLRRSGYKIELLNFFSHDPSPLVRSAVADYRLCPVEILKRLSLDPSSQVRESVVCHPDCPSDILFSFENHSSDIVRMRVMRKRERAEWQAKGRGE